jgi:hypothetical protein
MGRPKETWPIIRPRKNKQAKIISWMVDCGMMDVEGNSELRRVRYFYKTKAEAETKAGLLRIKRQNEGESAFGLSAIRRTDAQAALALLEPHSKTLLEAAQFLLDNIDVIRSNKTYSAVVTELLQAKEQDKKAARYIQDMRNRLATSEELFGDRLLYQIKRNEYDDWLRSLPISGTTRNNFRRILSVLLGYAVSRGYILRNPIAEIAVVKVERSKPPILSLAEAGALMAEAEPELTPPLALALFAGLRPESEIFARDHPLDWSQIELDNPEHRVIDVQQSKTVDSQRYVDISDNLVAWLSPYVKRKGPVCTIAYYDRLRGARDRAIAKLAETETPGPHLENWPIDIARHTFASNLYAVNKDAHKTSEQLGHYGGVRIFLRHYKNRVKQPDGLAFWEIRPADRG